MTNSPYLTSNTSSNYYHLVDAVRFISALLVLLFHLGYSTWHPESGAAHIVNGTYTIPEGSKFWLGWVGVQVFFVISGFVIANSAKSQDPIRFLKSRIVRLYPAAWICATISLLVAISFNFYSHSELTQRYLHSITLLPLDPWMEGVYWTLGTEMFFYALVFMLLVARRFVWIGALAHSLSIFSSSFILVVLLHRLGVVDAPKAELLSQSGIGKKLMFWYGVFFALGIYIWMWSTGPLGRLRASFAAYTLVFCCLQICLMAGTTEIGQDLLSATMPVFAFIALVSLVALSAICKNSGPYPPWTRSWFRTVGLTTYPLYLVHFSLGTVLIRELAAAGMDPYTAFWLTSAAIVLLSIFIAHYLEPATQRALRYTLDQLEVFARLTHVRYMSRS